MAAPKKKKTASTRQSPLIREDEARFVIDAAGHIIYASRAFARLTGDTPAKLKGRPLSELIEFEAPDDAIRTQSLFSAARNDYIDAVHEGTHKIRLSAGGKQETLAFQFDMIDTGDGRRFMIGAAVADEQNAEKLDGAFARKLVQFIDGDARQTAKPAVKSKISDQSDEGELRHFLNMSNDLMAISHIDGTFSRVNTAFNEIMGYSDEELRQKTFIDLVHPDERAHVRNCLYGLMHEDSGDGQIIDFEARVITKDGTVRWAEWRQKRSGTVIYTVGRDVTAIKQHEGTLSRQEQMLREAQAIGHMGHWHWIVGAEDIVWSDEIYRIFGVEKDGFVPTLDNLNTMLHRRDLGRLMQAFQRAIIEQNNYEMDFRIIRPDDEVRYIRCEGKCEFDEDGEVTALFGIMQDITEHTLHERQLKEAKDAAERAYAAKTQFLANMSHELRTPLNAIIGFSEMMQRQLLGPIGTEKYLDYIAGIRESGEHLLDLISDILDMSKIEAGKYELDLEELNAAKVIRLAVHMMEGRAQDARIKITIDIVNEDLQIVCDRRAFMQILLNLLSNAVKFTDPGGDVRIECIERDDYISIKVHDTGIGIPANKIKCITNPFEQAASHYTREHEGTGLGLSITKDLVELHGGSMHIDSTVGVGTSVTIRLPYNAYDQIKKRRKS
ncbi:MAG: PAS domain-containing protein [Rhodospirillales bacterium]|nr:PAS domain-containing protein [Rhodospirillales bacterium]MCB9996167.1 PAS domain-containing protein [Rhodospirillales bacterium]